MSMREVRFGNWHFTFRPVATAVAAAGIVVMVLLGNWQTRRAEQKLAVQNRLDALALGPVQSLPSRMVSAADYVYHRVSVRGEFAPLHTIFVDNRVFRGLPGYHVVTPLRIQGGDTYVLVNRGWVALGSSRARLPQVRTPAGELGLEGVAVVPPERVYELSTEAGAGPLVQHLVLARIAERTGLKLQPIVLQQTSDTADGLERAWERPDLGVNTNRAYALQWYAMGMLIVVFYFTLNLRRQHGPG
jgi:surfeit locus 1 family protein